MFDANSKGGYYDPIGTPPYQDPYVNFMKKHCHIWTYNAVAVQEDGRMGCFTLFIDVKGMRDHCT